MKKLKHIKLFEEFLNEAKKKIKKFQNVKVGDVAMENPLAGGVWGNELGFIIWKGNYKQLKTSKHKNLLLDLEYQIYQIPNGEKDDEYLNALDFVVVDDENYGNTLYAYDDDPSSVVVFK